jgi:hypothetical protein
MAPAAETRGGVQALVCDRERNAPLPNNGEASGAAARRCDSAPTPEALAQHDPAIHVLLPVAQLVVPAQLE